MNLKTILSNQVTSSVILAEIEPEELTLPNKCITTEEVNFLINNKTHLTTAQVPPIVKDLLTIFSWC